MNKPMSVPWIIIASLCAAVLADYVSTNAGSRLFHHDEAVHEQHAILTRALFVIDGKPADVPEVRNRVLFPLLQVGAARVTHLSESQTFILMRLLTAVLAFAAVLVAVGGTTATGCAVLGILSACCIAAFDHPWEVPSDFLDVLFMATGAALVLARRYAVLAALALVAALNRESAAFLGVLWAVVWGAGREWREWVAGATLSVVSYGEALVLRTMLRVPSEPMRQLLGIRFLPARLRAVVSRPQPFAWPLLLLACVVLVGWLAYITKEGRTVAEQRLLIAAGLLVIPTLVFGLADEIRIFLPVFTIAIVACGRVLARQSASLPP
jgi:hypothetical protein